MRPLPRGPREKAVQGKGGSCPSLLGARRLRTCRFRARARSPGGPAWAEILEEPPTGGRGQEDWNNGTMECRSDALGDRPPSQYSNIPVFHYSIVIPAGGWPLVPGSSRVFRARRASLRSSARREPTGPVQNGRRAGEGRFALALNRLFSSWLVVPTGIPPSRPCLPAFLVDASDRTSYI
jgi:hypothetical protein